MKYVLDTQKLARVIHQQRANRGFREIAAELGDISASTILRLESGKCPDMAVFLRICQWLKVSPGQFFIDRLESDEASDQPPADYSLGQIIDLLRSDKGLSPTSANVLIALVTAGYRIT